MVTNVYGSRGVEFVGNVIGLVLGG